MTTYSELFSIGQFRVLFGVRLATMLGVVVSALALGTVVYAQTGSPLASAVATFGGPLLRLVTGHSLLAAADLVRPRTAIVLTCTVAGLTDLAQLAPGLPWWGRFALLAIGEIVVGATSGTVVALVADLVPPEAFALGRATIALTVGGMQIVGYAVGAALLATLSPVHLFALSGAVSLLAAAIARVGLTHRGPRARGRVVARTRQVNRALLTSTALRPVFIAAWVPNGLIVGCEALFIPLAGERAGWLFAAGAAGMLAGDLLLGRFVSERGRDRLLGPLRVLLALPYLAFVVPPPAALAAGLVLVSAFGYPAGLALQDRLARLVEPDTRGQAFGLYSTGVMVGQGLGAAIGGALASVLGTGAAGAARAMVALAVASLLVSALLTPGLRRSAPP